MTDYAEPLVRAQKDLQKFANEAALGRWHAASILLSSAQTELCLITAFLHAKQGEQL